MRTYTAGGGRHDEGSGLLQRAGRRDRERGKVKFERQEEWDKGNMEGNIIIIIIIFFLRSKDQQTTWSCVSHRPLR